MYVTTDASGNASFTFPSPVRVPVGQFIAALATRLEAGSLAPIVTSEFSAGLAVTTAVTSLPPVDTVGPTISSVLASWSPNVKGTPVVLTFSEALGPASAVNLSNYRLVTAGRDKKFGTKDDKVIALRSATYNPTTRKVTLVPRKKLAVSVKYRLTANGTSASGVEDLAGNLLDGNHDGRVSGNYVDIFKLAPAKARR
jgi:Bacterial Ig-like domain